MIKTIIFDFDCTIYVGDNGDINKANDKFLVDKCFGKGVYEDFVERFGVNKKDIKDIVEICCAEGMDYEKLAKAFGDYPFIHKIKDKLELLPNEFFRKLSQNHHLYVISMSQMKYLQHYFKLYDIDKSCFKELLCMDLINHTSKADMFEIIMEKENCKPEEMLMIGDNPIHDIQPAHEMGMNALLFLGDFNQIYDFLTESQVCDCTEFKNLRKFVFKDGKIKTYSA